MESTSLEISCLRWRPTPTIPTTPVALYHPFYPQLYHMHSIRTKCGTLGWVRKRKDTPEVFKRLDSRNTIGCTDCCSFIQCRLAAWLLQLLCSLLLFLLLINYFPMECSWMEHCSFFATSWSDLLRAFVCRHTKDTIWIETIATWPCMYQQSLQSNEWPIVKRLWTL